MKDKKPRVGILTTFADLRPEYSLAGVVRQQLQMLLKYGYKPVLFVLNIFNNEDVPINNKVPEGVEIRKIVPQLLLEPYSAGNADNLEKDVEKVIPAFRDNMKDIDIMLVHDLCFINSYLPYNIAMRRGIDQAGLSHIRWLHWMHSGPSFRNLDGSVWDNLATLPKNSRIVYMNSTDQLRAAEHYHTTPDKVRVISNPMDIRNLYEFDPLTNKIIEDYGIMNADFIGVYPLSTTRMDQGGKQLSKAIRIMAELKKRGFSVRYIICNAHANAQHEKDEIERMYQFAGEKGLTRNELIFTSLIEPPKWEQGVSHKVVRDFFTLGNLFIFPTVSENCPLVLLEAMASKNLLVLNQSFPALKDFGRDNALYFHFGSLVDNPTLLTEDKYYSDIALLIEVEYKQNKSLKANTVLRKEFNIDYIWRHQLEPAIMEMYNG